MPVENLSTALFRETRGLGFFRVLSGRNAPFYVDVLDTLERETSERADGMAREEAVVLIVETLERHPGFEFDSDAEGADAAEQSADICEGAGGAAGGERIGTGGFRSDPVDTAPGA